MKKMRRTASIVLAMLMVLIMAVPAFAVSTQTGTIVIDNAESTDAKAYKVFDWKDGVSAPVYTIEESSPWFGLVATEISEGVYQSKISGITMVKNDSVYELQIAEGLNKAQFVKDAQDYFNANIKGTAADDEATPFTTVSGKAQAELPYGYYFINTEMGAFVNVNTATKSITDKGENDMAFDKTKEEASEVEVGQVIHFALSAKVPDTKDYLGFKYVMKDKMDEGLTLDPDSITVMIGDTTLIAGDDTYTVDADATGFTLNFNMKKLTANGAHKDEMVQVKYNATVNSKAVNQVEWNKAELTYTKKSGEETLTDKEYVYTFKLVIDKTDGGANKLANAKFVLKSGDKFYKVDADGTVSWVDNQEDATEIVTDASGAADFSGIKAGAYQLIETEAPTGYNAITDPIDIVLRGLSAEEVEEIAMNPSLVDNRLVLTQTVENFSGNLLPETGGIGTTIFYLVGGVLVVGAAALLIAKKRAAK